MQVVEVSHREAVTVWHWDPVVRAGAAGKRTQAARMALAPSLEVHLAAACRQRVGLDGLSRDHAAK